MGGIPKLESLAGNTTMKATMAGFTRFSFGAANGFMAILIIIFNQLVCIPLLTTSVGTVDKHIHACGSVGVDPKDYSTVMDSNLQNAVRSYEQNEAEMMKMNFLIAIGFATAAHGLTMFGIFGLSVPDLASHASADCPNPLRKTLITLFTLFVLTASYVIIIVAFINALPHLSGEDGGEWTKPTDFGLENADGCNGINPWFENFLDELHNYGIGVTVILQLSAIICIIANGCAFSNSKAE